MELKGKQINFLGDSITEGVGIASVEDAYWNLLKQNCGLLEARGYGIGGTRIARQHLPENPLWDQDFISRVDGMEPEADVIVVFGGTNDFGHGDAPLGTTSDRTPYTFYGACHVLIRKLLERYPEAELVFMTPLHRYVEERGGRRLKDFVQAIRETAEYYGISVVDLYARSGIQPQLECMQKRYCPDGLHPNEAGHQRIYRRLRGALESL